MTTTQKTIVVNLRRAAYDIYIGRAGHGEDGYFGNPFRLAVESQRVDSLAQFKTYFLLRIVEDADFKRRVLALRGKRLGCFCKPLACHGDVIAKWIDENFQ